MENNKVTQTYSIAKDVVKKVKSMAKDDGRSVSNYVERVLLQHVEQVELKLVDDPNRPQLS